MPGLTCAGDPPGNPGKTTASPDTANGPGTVAWVPDPMTMRPTTTTRRLTPPVTLEPTASEEPTANCEITHRARGAATPSLPPDPPPKNPAAPCPPRPARAATGRLRSR